MYLDAVTTKAKHLIYAYCMITLAYLVALFFAWLSVQYFLTDHSLLITTLLADLIATSIIFIFSSAFRNASFYDPYWSVAPFFITLFWMSEKESAVTVADVLLLFVLTVWGTRLTLNWIRGWNGLDHEDWRYKKLKQQSGKWYPLVNFAGIHLFPTLMVFLAMLPAYTVAVHPSGINWPLVLIASFTCLVATLIEYLADEQQRIFRKSRSRSTAFYRGKLWKFSRHPNYFGEVLFWWGIFLFGLACNPQYWYYMVGAAAITLLFVFISIPMMEQHLLERYAGYDAYRKEVSALIPWFHSARP